MIIRSTLATFAFLLLGATTLAAPALKGDITVIAGVVTVGDMFDEAGLAAEDALFRAPKPGTTGNVSLADIRAAAARTRADPGSGSGCRKGCAEEESRAR